MKHNFYELQRINIINHTQRNKFVFLNDDLVPIDNEFVSRFRVKGFA